MYVNPSKKVGYEATVRVVVTAHGEELKLLPQLQAAVKDWVKSSFPFTKVAYLGIDTPMSEWNALPDVE